MIKARRSWSCRRAQAVSRRSASCSSATPPVSMPSSARRSGPRTRPQLEPDNPKRRALDALPTTDLAAKYVALAIDCEQPKLMESVDVKALLATYDGVPLMRFRLSTCGRARRAGGRRAARRRSALDRHAVLGRPPRAGLVDRPGDRSAEGSQPVCRRARSVPGVRDADHGLGQRQHDRRGVRRRAVGIRRRAGGVSRRIAMR